MADILDSANTPVNDAAQTPQGSLIVPAEPEIPPTVNPPEPPPPPVQKSEPNVRSHKGMVIALSLLFIFLTTGLVFVFVNQQQSLNDIRNKASDLYPPTWVDLPPSGICPEGYAKAYNGGTMSCGLITMLEPEWKDPVNGSCPVGYDLEYDGSSQRCRRHDYTNDNDNCGGISIECPNGKKCVNSECVYNTDMSCGRDTDPGAPVCCVGECDGEIVCEPPARKECLKNGVWCTMETNSDWCRNDNDDDDNNPTPRDENTPTPTTIVAQCTDITIYKDGIVVTPSTLLSGDAVVIAVRGDNATRARIRVNNGAWNETTTTNASGEFTLSYTLPAGVTNFTIESEIYGVDGVWK